MLGDQTGGLVVLLVKCESIRKIYKKISENNKSGVFENFGSFIDSSCDWNLIFYFGETVLNAYQPKEHRDLHFSAVNAFTRNAFRNYKVKRSRVRVCLFA